MNEQGPDRRPCSDWIPDYTMEAPEGHVWLKPPPDDCPNCECCTAKLCQLADEKDTLCRWLVDRGEGVMDVRNCPCSAPIEQRLRAKYAKNAAETDEEN